MKSPIPFLALLVLAAPLGAQAPSRPRVQSDPSPSEDRRIADLERRLDAMSQALEAQQAGTTMPEAPAEGRYGMAPGASKVYDAPVGLSLGGYGEFLYQGKAATLQDGTRVGSTKTADALRMVLYTGYKFTNRILFDAEFEWEHGGYSDESPEGEAIAEFAYLDFLLSKPLNVRAGMMLVPVGFINERHEPPTFLGARRPLVENEGGIIPTTWNEDGVGLHGDLPGHFSYRLYLMDGLDGSKFTAQGITAGRQLGKQANAQSLAWTGRLDWMPVPGALVGGSFYTGNSNQTGTGPALQTRLFDLHAEYRAEGLQLRGLYARTTNSSAFLETLPVADPARQTGTRQWGGYLEAGYDVLRARSQSLIPFLRWERLNTQSRVLPAVVADGAMDQTVLTAGVNYLPLPNVAIKSDYQRLANGARTGRDQWNLGFGFYF